MKYSSIPAAQAVVQHCQSRNIQNIVISPGSRNAPLTIGFTQNPFFNCFSVVDERAAAFFALGMAQQLQHPVVLVCTSGSAVLNYYPAVAEAYYSGIPLVVISADRPDYKVDIGDGQTIKQDGVLSQHCGFSTSIAQDIVHSPASYAEFKKQKLDDRQIRKSQDILNELIDEKLNEALNCAIEDSTPVHINMHFEEPLYNTVDTPLLEPEIIEPESGKENESPDWEALQNHWNEASRIMVLVGTCYPECLEKTWCEKLAADPRVLVLTETTSNLHHPGFISSIDSLIAPLEIHTEADKKFEELQPDLLITLGGMVVSKKIKAFLRKYSPKAHWHADVTRPWDTYYSLSKHIRTAPNTFFKQIYSGNSDRKGSYQSTWLPYKDRYEEMRQAYLGRIQFSDFLAFHRIFKSVPAGYQLQLANSTTVRYSQLFPYNTEQHTYCNRGTSGIEGSISTAVGASIYHEHPTLMVTGDLSVLYDSHGFWNEAIRDDFRIIVVNNNGGGIFRILPKAKDVENFEEYFETVHHLDLQKMAALYGLEHRLATDLKTLNTALESFYEASDKPRILEVRTPRLLNDKILLAYFDFIS